jgi:hypothetical protein
MLAAVSCTRLNEVKKEAALFDCIGIDEGQFVCLPSLPLLVPMLTQWRSL